MVQITDGVEGFSADNVCLYYTTDSQLSDMPLLVFHGASTTINATMNSSRIQIHVFSAGGFQSYPRLTVSPNSPFYSAITHLPREKQGDEVCRGLAFGLLKYFKDLPEVVKNELTAHLQSSRGGRLPSPLFMEEHAANLASTMIKVENTAEVLQDIKAALAPQSTSHIDIDLVLPPGSILTLPEGTETILYEDGELDPSLRQYGKYSHFVSLFGEACFLPTSKLRRAPSKPTAPNRTNSLLRNHKILLHREIRELLDTEERYVIKVHELVNQIAADFREKARDRPFGSFSPSETDLEKLFPSSLDKILQVNSAFLAAIRKVLEETENVAMQDLEAAETISASGRYGGSSRLKDPTGALAFANVLLEWFPQFSDCYQSYIRASQDFPQIITSLTKEQSSFKQRVQQTGEQRLRSAVIEPVQRLPRYNLFIDNIVNLLPLTHPALQPMLKARDTITAICFLDPPLTDKSQVVNRLRNLMETWPSSLAPQSRLISACDFVELLAPYNMSRNSCRSDSGILLLFADFIVVLRKSKGCKLSARGIIAEVDRPSATTMMAPVTAAAEGQKFAYELSFGESYVLGETRFTESGNGQVVWMFCQHPLRPRGPFRDQSQSSKRVFLLEGAYLGKASKWIEEVTKAKIEGRFSETERETDKWCLRNVNLKENGLTLHTAVFEEGIDTLNTGRKEPAPVRIVVDHVKGTKGAPVGHYGVDIVANVKVPEEDSEDYGLQIDGLNSTAFIDVVDLTTFMPVFAKRVGDLLHSQCVAGNPALTSTFILNYSTILKAVQIQLEGDKLRSFRPPSPVKLLSSFLGSSGLPSSMLNTAKSSKPPLLSNTPFIPPTLSRSGSQKMDGYNGSKPGRTAVDEFRPSNPLVRLEETFISYVAALQSRKGNTLVKSLRNRTSADVLSVNALYNALIQNPLDTRITSEISVDILFVAFQKFLKIAWKDQIEPIMTLQTLQALEEKSLRLFPGDFAEYLKLLFGDMPPQNKRAFVAIVKLLADLLEGCENDGDRGALTAAFAELLVPEGDPHNYVNLLDRLVEDSERLFDDIGASTSSGLATPISGSANSGSVTSNTSSFRKRFGFDTLVRQNSKNSLDVKGSMWRTLSKSHRNLATGDPKISSKSTDIDIRLKTLNQQSAASGHSPLSALGNRPSSSQSVESRLTAISTPPPQDITAKKSIKKNRRSSLSDLNTLVPPAALKSPPPIPTRHLPPLEMSARTPSPMKPNAQRLMIHDRPSQKENELSTRGNGSLAERSHNIMSDDVNIKDVMSAGKAYNRITPMSNIPTLNGVVRDRTPSASPPPRSTHAQGNSLQKLRIQNAQKLRERLQHEAKEINTTNESLQLELSKIGVEMTKLNTGRAVRVNPIDFQRISDSVKTLESKIPTIIKDFTSRNDALKKDVETSLQASEYKAKGLDQLYKEASAENELLYEKFNNELSKVVKALKGKGKEDKAYLVARTEEAMEEAANAKKENSKLRKEILTLRTLLKGNA